ncbi:hypothetical protein SS50377_20664 [Spironucleus salmonicida]|uniref:Uncharacterized protein n=1 Tax=Spironucleus salmonicida TaxID=348837 RepID=A0A9P8LZS3_9EUKA|nr:hypothetical protein SS50377_20664 [Spironucleus salmonicida]
MGSVSSLVNESDSYLIQLDPKQLPQAKVQQSQPVTPSTIRKNVSSMFYEPVSKQHKMTLSKSHSIVIQRELLEQSNLRLNVLLENRLNEESD